ncbi:glycosyltransferase family 2 protein [Terricaulis sp.]|uniref:glycosyltransferase family 2 protein n=1 Tax=Terricaulis sp. TaxID=2768686 RepID=UPI00378491C4
MDKIPPLHERQAQAALGLRVSAVVVARDAGPGVDLCLRSAIAEPWIDDIVVVDHGNSPDISSALRAMQADRRDMKLITVDRAKSHAFAANRGVEQARGRWVLFLDPDVVLQRGAVARLAAVGGAVRTTPPWIAGGLLMDTEGRDRRAVRAGELTTWSAVAVAMNLPGPKMVRKGAKKRKAVSDDEGEAIADPQSEATKVAAVSGAFMMIQRSDFEALNGFDEEFQSHGADLDLCRRATEHGGSVLFHPAATGVQFLRPPSRGRREAQGLARFAQNSAKTRWEKAFGRIAEPAFAVLVWLRDAVGGRPPVSRR